MPADYDRLNRAYQKYMRRKLNNSSFAGSLADDSTATSGSTFSFTMPFTYVSENPVVPKKQSTVLPQTGKRMITLED